MPSLQELEAAALNVIDILKSINDFQDATIAVIGGLALWKYLPTGRTTEDIDFIISVQNAPQSVKQKLLNLPGSPFVQRAQLFFFKPTSGGEIQIDMVPSLQAPYVPADAIKLKDVPKNVIPYISIVDLLVFKIFSCGLRAEVRKRRVDASDAENLISQMTTPLNLASAQKTLIEPCIDDLVANGKRSKEWWLQRLGALSR